MASTRSSADEGEIVEGHRAEQSKAKTHAAPAASALHRDGNRPSVDRRDRNHRGRSPRSPERPGAGAGVPYRNLSPRGLKRQRDDRNRDRDRWDNRRGGRRYEDESVRDRRDRELRYDDTGNRGKRQRTRSRSPPPPADRGNNGRGWNDRSRQDRGRDGGRDGGRDRDWGDRSGRRPYDVHQAESVPGQGPQQRSARSAAAAAGLAGNGVAKSVKGVSFHLSGESGPVRPGKELPVPQDWAEPEPIDEEAEIRRRRQRREEILKKSRASTPLQAVSIQADKAAAPTAVESNTQVKSPETGNNTPRSGETPKQSVAVEDAFADSAIVDSSLTRGEAAESEGLLDLADDRAFMDALGKHAIGDGPDVEDGPSAADYDPTVDMEIDERRDELRHGLTAAVEMDLSSEAADVTAPDTGNNDGGDDSDEDDMFAEDFVEKKYVAPTTTANGTADTAAAKDAAAAAAPANGGGILEGDDQQGYYKIRPGEVLDGRYQVLTALGKGMFSGVGRARDIASADGKREVAIKIMRNNDALRKGGYTEIAILEKLNEADANDKKHIVRFERAFDYRGHLCMAFENLSMNLREVLKKFGNNVVINLTGVRVFAYQIFVALAHMRRCSIIHADLKPDNILVNETRTALKICDLGTAIDRSDAVTAHNEITPYLVSRFYRAPEIILGMPYDHAIDMWSIGCTLYELYTGKILFAGESNNQMLRAIMEIRGKISAKLYRRGDLWPMHFDDMGGFLSQEHDKFQAKTTVKTLTVIKPTRDLRTRLLAASAGMDDAETKELNQFHDLLDRCLSLNPDKRILPGDALKHPFFTQRSAR
ncbi:serine/threonine-protein kinase [Grosmannia clavigera kw1407]|uniref:non-specific serine/threonine protein kinase n=1 Tax=Grosmannia clavigera (strain kw1407 / UAMH 11150) TaxID=655863 RepID=F0XPD9_GROCL|nr:serine/threonine-protein kinase [Grosmannia clavigera kw1407]EFX00404.1 serine/threonine-protein kinase [Grosmannia clavigera kw1407]